MSILSGELQKSLDAAFVAARGEGHDLLTVEHLLLALMSDTNVAEVLNATGADLESLEQGLKDYILKTVQALKDEGREVQPTLSFQRVLQRAIYHVQSAGKKQVSTLNVLVALFSEKDTHAVFLLNEQGVARLDELADSALSHLEACGCESGCPSCVGLPTLWPAQQQDPDLQPGREIPGKESARVLLRHWLGHV